MTKQQVTRLMRDALNARRMASRVEKTDSEGAARLRDLARSYDLKRLGRFCRV